MQRLSLLDLQHWNSCRAVKTEHWLVDLPFALQPGTRLACSEHRIDREWCCSWRLAPKMPWEEEQLAAANDGHALIPTRVSLSQITRLGQHSSWCDEWRNHSWCTVSSIGKYSQLVSTSGWSATDDLERGLENHKHHHKHRWLRVMRGALVAIRSC